MPRLCVLNSIKTNTQTQLFDVHSLRVEREDWVGARSNHPGQLPQPEGRSGGDRFVQSNRFLRKPAIQV